MYWITVILALLPVLIVLFPVWKSLPFFAGMPAAAWLQLDWAPDNGDFGIGVALFGSLYIVALALPLCILLGWLMSLQLAENRNHWLTSVTVPVLEVWVSMPSVVVGVWALSQLAPLVRAIEGSGYCVLTAALGLTLLIFPTATLLFYRSYTAHQTRFQGLEKTFALNALDRTLYFFKSQPALLVSTISYCFCRLFGETLVVLMLAGNSVQIAGSLFDSVRTLTATIALEMDYASGMHETALFALASICLVVILLVLLPQFRSRHV